MKRSLIIVICAAISSLFIFTSCAGSPSSATVLSSAPTVSATNFSSASASQQSAAVSASASPSASQAYKVGDTIKYNDMELTVTKVEKSNGKDFDKPQKNTDEFIIVSVSIKNDGTDQLPYNLMYFQMQNSQGQITNPGISLVDQQTELNSGNLIANGHVSGTVLFEEPKNDPGLVLLYNDQFGGTPELQITLSASNEPSTSASADTSASALKTSAEASSSQSSSGSQAYGVGQTVKLDNMELTVAKVTKSNGTQYDKPQKSGDEYVIVSLTIKNNGTDQLPYNSMYFTMQNSQGQVNNTWISTVDQNTDIGSGNLAGNGSVSGTIVFEEPKNDTGLVLFYNGPMFSQTPLIQIKIS